jgi:sRNA-binding carbon storage regulator CsrA
MFSAEAGLRASERKERFVVSVLQVARFGVKIGCEASYQYDILRQGHNSNLTQLDAPRQKASDSIIHLVLKQPMPCLYVLFPNHSTA